MATPIFANQIQWYLASTAIPGTWAATTSYALGATVASGGKSYICTTAGKSGTTAPTWPASGTVTDGTVVWTLGAASGYNQVTEDSTFDPSRDTDTYEPKYKCTLNKPSYVTGTSTKIKYEIDLTQGNAATDFLQANEDGVNVPVKLCRVLMWKNTTGTSYEAKEGTFALTPDPTDGKAGDAAVVSGSMSMTSDGWTKGTFDTETKTFTAGV